MDIQVFTFIGGTVGNAVDAFLVPAASRLMVQLSGIVTIGLVLYVALVGAGILVGANRQPIGQFVIIILKVSFISAIAFNNATYTTYIVDTFSGLETGLASAINGLPNATSIYSVLDNVAGEGAAAANTALAQVSESGMFDFGGKIAWALCAGVIGFATVVIGVLGGGAILVAKFMIAVLMAIGPLFLMLALWPVTSKYFDSWVSQVLNATLIIVIVGTVMSFATLAFSRFLGAADLTGAGVSSPIAITIEVAALSAILCFVIYQSNSMAAGLAGGLSTAAFTAGSMAASIRTPANVVNPRSTRRDLQSGMQSSASRLDHIVAGNTPMNPAYTRQLMSRIGQNYALKSDGGKVKNKT